MVTATPTGQVIRSVTQAALGLSLRVRVADGAFGATATENGAAEPPRYLTRHSMTTPTFEELYRELAETIERLESGDLPLEEALALYERGARLAEQCNAVLDQAELRVRRLSERADGGLEATPFDGWQT